MRSIKLLFSILCVAMLSGVILSGCSDSATQNGPDSARPFDVGSVDKSQGGGYVWGLPYISESAKTYGTDGRLQAEYDKWNQKYVTADGCGMDQLRVARDMNSQYDTVSEGIGYGMLLAVYFNDQGTFDQLYNYCKSHFIRVNGNTVNLMHWKQDVSGTNVSEFADYNIDYSVFNVNGVNYYSQSTAIPHGAVFGSITTGLIFVTPDGSEGSGLVNLLDNNPNYYRMFKKGDDRTYSSATDADEDIAAALAFASKVWGSSSIYGIDYNSEARTMIKAIEQYDFNPSNGFIKAGNGWGDNTCWNPSYFTPAYYLNVYAAICPEDTTFWQKAYTTMYAEMYKVVNAARKISGSYSKIFFPDWCDTSAYTSSKQVISNGKLSDRIYYNNGQQTDITDNDGMTCPLSARWKAGTTKSQYTATNMMSFNSYYDAVRVPYRLTMDYIWDSKSMWIPNGMYDIQYYSGNVLNYVYQSFAAQWGSGYTSLKDGYTIAGAPWKYADRDGFNVNTGSSAGGQWYVAEFASMTAPTELRKGGTPPATSAHFDAVVAKDCYSGTRGGNYGYNYFGNTVRLLSLVMLTGKFENLYNAPPANGTMVRIYNKQQSNWFLNIEDKVSHVVECHDGSLDWWSAQWTINRNSDGYYTFKNKWQAKGYDAYLHCEDQLATAEWDTVTTGGNKGKNPNAGMYSAQWLLVQSQDTGYFVLKNRWTNKILTIRDMIPAATSLTAVKVQTTTSSWGTADRQWRFEVVQ